jgi:hypothetical protein
VLSTQTVGQRIAAREMKVAKSETALLSATVTGNSERKIGRFAGDEYAKKVDELFRKTREAVRHEARRGPSKDRARKNVRAEA